MQELFDLLRQVSSLFLVPPEALKTLVCLASFAAGVIVQTPLQIEDTAIHKLGHADL